MSLPTPYVTIQARYPSSLQEVLDTLTHIDKIIAITQSGEYYTLILGIRGKRTREKLRKLAKVGDRITVWEGKF